MRIGTRICLSNVGSSVTLPAIVGMISHTSLYKVFSASHTLAKTGPNDPRKGRHATGSIGLQGADSTPDPFGTLRTPRCSRTSILMGPLL